MIKIPTSLLSVCVILLLAMVSCKKDKTGEIDEDGTPSQPVNINLKEADIALPAGTSYDLSGHTLMSFGAVQPVGKDGKTKAADIPKSINVAYLYDKDDNPVMAGFITDNVATISVESTAKVALYYGLGTVFQPDTVREIFIEKIGQEAWAADWINSFVDQWKTNPHFFSEGAYAASLKSLLGRMTDTDEPTDIRKIEKIAANRTSDITVDNGDVRSGIQLSAVDGEFSKIKITNRYRRRAHAFIYKTKFKPVGDKVYKGIIPDPISETTVADKDLLIGATSGITGITGSLGKVAQGKGMDFAVTSNGPIELELGTHEEEAIYKVRVVGPGGKGPDANMTRDEVAKLDRLIIETFAFDFLMPAIGMGIGVLDESQKDIYIEATDAFLKVVPGVYDELNKGDFKAAIFSVMETAGTEAVNIGLQKLYEKLQGSASVGDGAKAFAKKVANQLNVVDKALQVSDWGVITGEFLVSKRMDEWEVTARASNVSLRPETYVLQLGGQHDLEASIQNVEEWKLPNLRFEWKTSGKYGYIADRTGEEGSSFESKKRQIYYKTNVYSDQLGDYDNWEYVYVKVYHGEDLVGLDTAKINVKKTAYAIKPSGITLTGRKVEGYSESKRSSNRVNLYLEPVNRNIPSLWADTERDFKIIWSTAGKHGGLSAVEGGGKPLTSVTLYEDDGVIYECTDDETRTGTEEIVARIYARPAGTQDAYELYDEVKGKINIDNDPKKRIVHLPVKLMTGDKVFYEEPFKDSYGNTYYSHRCYAVLGATFSPEPDDAHYSWRITTAIGHSDGNSWSVGQDMSHKGWGYGDAAEFFNGSTYTLSTGLGSWAVGPYYPDGGSDPSCNYTSGDAPDATCILIVTLK